MDAVTFHPAVAADAAAGARLHVTCWREAYAPYVDADRLEQRLSDIEGREQLWLRVIEGGNPWLLAEHEGELVGFAHAGPAGPDEPAPRQ
ncbi:MAG: hypothetical protein Q8Q44_04375, partial [Nocardioides sp.]|nr:hypothetical protein [Nocardioides sp.]